MSNYLTVQETAERLRRSPSTIRNMMDTENPRIPFRRLAGSPKALFVPAELDDLVNGNYSAFDVKHLPGGGVAVTLVPPTNGNGNGHA